MSEIIHIIAPVFVMVLAGYMANYVKFISDAQIDALQFFTQSVALPCLLFLAVWRLDLGTVYDWQILAAYYPPALLCFGIGMILARVMFNRRPGETVAVGFTTYFGNMVLIGLPVMERAYGADSLSTNYVLLSIHAPIGYTIGIFLMETLRADGRGRKETSFAILRAVFRNTLMMGILLGFIANFLDLNLPSLLLSPLEWMRNAALPVALFALGGALVRFEILRNLPEVAAINTVKLVIFPMLVLFFAHYLFALPAPVRNSMVISAALSPGINGYVFASLYERAKATSACAVVFGTFASTISMPIWLLLLRAIG